MAPTQLRPYRTTASSLSHLLHPHLRWVRSDNLSDDISRQLTALKKCNRTLYHSPHLVGTLPSEELLHYFGSCWRGTWRDFVTNSMVYVCVKSWLASGFKPSQFMVMRSEVLRNMPAKQLLGTVSNFTGLHYNKEVLHDKEEELAAHCEAPDSRTNKERDGRAQQLGSRAAGAPMVNSHKDYDGHDAQRRTQLTPATLAELTRLHTAYGELLGKLNLRGLS